MPPPKSQPTTKRKAEGTPGRGDPKAAKCDTDDASISDAELNESVLQSIMNKLSSLDGLSEKLDDIQSSLTPLQNEIQQVKSDIHDMRSAMGDMESRISGQCKSNTADAIREYHDEVTSKLSAQLDRFVQEREEDKAKLTAVLYGVPNAADRPSLTSMLKSVNDSYRSYRIFTTKAGKTMGILSFGSMSDRNAYVNKFRESERSLKVCDTKHTVSISNGKSKLQRERNASLRSMHERLVKAAAKGQKFEINWIPRTISLNGTAIMKQERLSPEVVDLRKIQ